MHGVDYICRGEGFLEEFFIGMSGFCAEWGVLDDDVNCFVEEGDVGCDEFSLTNFVFLFESVVVLLADGDDRWVFVKEVYFFCAH